MVKKWDLVTGNNNNKTKSNQIFNVGLFQGDQWCLPTQNATNGIFIQEFHNVMAHYKPHQFIPSLALWTETQVPYFLTTTPVSFTLKKILEIFETKFYYMFT